MQSEFDYNTRTPFGTHKTHMSSETDYNTRILFGMHQNAHVKGDCPSLQLDSTRTETHMLSEIASSPHSIWHAQKTHSKMLKGIDFKFRTIFGTLRNPTCQVRMTCLTLFGALRKRTCQLRLALSLLLYLARTESAHVR